MIATLAEGVPASPPRHLQAAAVDAHSVSVTWEPGPFPHGPLLSYVLQIMESRSPSSGHEARSEVKVGHHHHSLFHSLALVFVVALALSCPPSVLLTLA